MSSREESEMKPWKRRAAMLAACLLALAAGVIAVSVSAAGPRKLTRGASDAQRLPATAHTPAPASGSRAGGSLALRSAPGAEASLPAPARRGAPPGAAQIRGRHDPRRVLIRFRSGTSAAERAAFRRETGATLEHRLSPENIDVLRLPRGRSVDAALARYRGDRRIALAEPNRIYAIQAPPNDPFFPGNGASASSDLWNLSNTGQAGGLSDADIDAPEAYDRLGLGASTAPWPTANFAVGVVDTGIDATHPDLTGKAIQPCSSALAGTGTLISGCIDDQGHGTHVAGTIAAVGNNGKGIVGVAPEARIYACKALDSTGSGYDADIAACMNDIVDHRDTYHIGVLSMSLGGTQSSAALSGAVDYAWNHGVLVVAAAGNDGNTSVEYPAGYAHAVSVGATDRNDGHASFSNVNADVEVSAPGVGIVSTVPTYPTGPPDSTGQPNGGIWDPSGYMALDGTSMATPHAAAVAALIAWQTGKSGQALRDALDASVDDLGAAGRDSQFGFGRVNACLALGGGCTYRGAAASTPPLASTTPTGTSSPTPSPPATAPPASTAPSPAPTAPPASTAPSPTTTAPATPVARAYAPTRFRVLSGTATAGSVRRLFANDSSRLEIAGRRSGSSYVSDSYAVTSVPPAARATLRRLSVDYDGNVSRAGSGLRLLVYDWSARRWSSVYVTTRAATRDRSFRWSTTRLPARFLSSAGEIRLRIRGSSRGSIRTRTDLVRFTAEY